MEDLFPTGVVTTNSQILFIFIFLIIYSFVLKGIVLWKAARKGQKGWFIALLLINTLGILEFLYIFVFSKKESRSIKNNNKSETDKKNETN